MTNKCEHSTRKDVVYSSNYTDINGTIKLLNRHAVNNMKDVDMICIPMNELIFGSDKSVYLACEDLLHYCSMVEIGYMCILAYITFHWMLHVIDLRENCVYILDSLRSKVNKDIHVVKDMASETRSTTLSVTLKWRSVKCPRELDSVGCGYYVQKYIHEIVHNSSTSITRLVFVGMGSLIVFGRAGGPVLDDCICCSTIQKCRKVCWCWILCIVGVYYWFAIESMRCLICVLDDAYLL
ncbi:hypothetical protein IC582_002205 [Cucumis melo]